MKFKSILLIIVAIVLAVGVAKAQVPTGLSEQQLKDLLSRVDKDTESFAKSADKALDKSGFNGTPREDELNGHLKKFKTATEVLEKNYSDPNAKKHVDNVIHHGVAIANFLRRNPLDGVEQDWTTLRSDLGQLATAYGVTWEEGEGHAKGTPVGEADIKNLLQHIEDMADKYKLTLDAAMDNSPLNNTSAEDQINSVNAEFRAATRRLEDNRNNDSAPQDAKEVLVRAKRINDFLVKHSAKLTPEVQSSWAAVRIDLDRLAKLYSVNWNWQ
jgi:hypothetical protein